MSMLLVLIGCSHNIQVRTTASKMLTAEAQGELLKGKLLFYPFEGSTAYLDLRDEKTDGPLSMQDRDTSEVIDISMSGELGLWGPVDFIHVGGGRSASDMSGLKLQLYGKHKASAGKYNFSVAAIVGYGAVTIDEEEGEDLELVPVDDDTTVSLKIKNSTYGLLIGYRPTEQIIVNLGHYIMNHSFGGTLDSQNSNLDGEDVDYNGVGKITTLGAFSHFPDSKGYFGIEFSHEVMAWDHSDTVNHVYTNLAAGLNW